MGSAETKGENRARKAAEEALASPLLDNRDILGAQKILLSIISGDQAELQMDELTEITEYIQEQAGDDAEVIFGHGVDPDLGDSIRVTVIATGFDHDEAYLPESRRKEKQQEKAQEQERKVYDLEANKQINMFANDNSVNNTQGEITKRDIDQPSSNTSNNGTASNNSQERGYSFTSPVNATDDDGDDGLFSELEEEFEIVDENDSDQHINEDGMMDIISTKDRLQEKAQERLQKLKGLNKSEMNANEFKEKLDVPAYLRREVRLQNVPHSSEAHVSKYNLNDDNQILGNNRFLHDNVD